MMISAKSRYALRVMVDLAQRNTGEFIPVKEIAARQGISLKYLESIMTILTKGKMLESASGKGGGYRLIKQPSEYKVIDILQLIEGNLAPVACLCEGGKKCESTAECTTLPFWQGLEAVINDYLEKHTLLNLCRDMEVTLHIGFLLCSSTKILYVFRQFRLH